MKLTSFQVHKSWLIRAALVLLVTCLAVSAVVLFVAKPIPWVGLIAGSLPLSMVVFVAMPLLRVRGRSQAGDGDHFSP